MADRIIEFHKMTESEMYHMVHEIYDEANLENAQWRYPGLADYSEAFKEEEMRFVDFLRTFMQKDNNSYYVLEVDSQWVSALRLTKIDDFYYLEALETAAKYRKKGFAVLLIKSVISLLDKQGPVTIRSNVNKKNIASLAVHKKCGFRIEEENGINYLTGEQNNDVFGMLYSFMENQEVTMEKMVETETIEAILRMYGFDGKIAGQKSYIHYIGEDGLIKLIFRVTLESGRMLVVKILHEEADLLEDRQKIEKQSIFSEFMRSQGIKTPARHLANGNYCSEYVYRRIPCNVTVEDWCGEEIKEINTDIAYQIGELMARMHTISLANKCEIGCGTLFGAAYWNDVDAYPKFCEIGEDEKLDQTVIAKIKTLREEKLERIREVWDTLPKAAVQGDISINNLVYGADELTVFDYNNAGDEVLISDLVMEGLLTAYEMDLPEGVPASCREHIFPALLKGYLSVRPLSGSECDAAWEVYTLYHGLWFTRVMYNEDSLEKLVEKGDYDTANQLLHQILTDMTEQDDGRFMSAG